jgi:hypothetical protein
MGLRNSYPSGSTFRYASQATKQILLGVETALLVWTASLYEWLAMIGQEGASGSGPGFGDAQVP